MTDSPLYDINEDEFFTEIDWLTESRQELEEAERAGDTAKVERILKWLGGSNVRQSETHRKKLEHNQIQTQEEVQ